jgi:hypothetical protein
MAVKSNLSLNINKDDSNINDFLYVWDYFKSRPNKITLHKTYVSNQFEEILKEYQKEINKFSEIIPSDEENIVNDKIIMTLCINEVICFISYVVVDRNYETSTISDITFFYKEQEDEKLIIDLIKKLDQCYIEFFDEEVNNLNTINFSSSSGLDLESVDPSVDLETFEMYYSASTIKKLNKLIKKVKKNDKGISIIYGERGTGKTSAISQIANKLDRIVIFIPNNMIEHTINNPDFRKFLKRYSKPIIVIDDCEMIFNDYLTKSNMVVNNLLQLSDGFLSETIDVTFIAIFNVEDENEIDRNLIECNNLIDIIDFEFLNSDEANELSIHLGEKAKYKNKTKLVDIIKKNTLQNNKKIGF